MNAFIHQEGLQTRREGSTQGGRIDRIRLIDVWGYQEIEDIQL